MATRSKLIQQVRALASFTPQSLSGSSEVFGSVIDTQGFDSVALSVFLGTLTGSGTHSIVVKVYENTANSTSGGTNVTSYVTDLATADANPITAAAGKWRGFLSLAGRKRYIYMSVTPTFGGSETAALIGGTCDLGDIQSSEPV